MPFLRILRDKRGIEHLCLLHPVGDGGRSRPRALYWFRTSQGAKGSGRLPLDETARREIEARFPDIAFDWEALWQAATTVAFPEPSGESASTAETERDETAAGREPNRTKGTGRPSRVAEPRDGENDRARPGRRTRARRRPRVARRVASMDTSPASEVS
ncbi:MAG: hypothetical protein GEV06_28740, partial [Luteitalea sp.]|nr:hypothetical protein [Luteitalea sp.]